MGVVIKQSGISSIIIYTGAIIGFINTVILFPAFLSTEQIGLIRVIPNIAFMMLPVAQLGLTQTLLKFYPDVERNKSRLAGFNRFIWLGVFLGSLLTSVGLFTFSEHIITYFAENAQLLTEYFYVVIVLIFVLSFHGLVETYCRLALKTIAINIVKEFLIRIFMSILVSLYFIKIISFHQLTISLIAIYGLALIVLLFYLITLHKVQFKFRPTRLDSNFLKRISSYGAFSIIGAGGSYLVLNIDQVMISAMIGLGANGIYTTSFFFAVIIDMSKRAINQITTPLISKSFQENNISEVRKIYRSTALNQSIIGALAFIGITSNLDSIYLVMPKGEEFQLGQNIIYIIGLAKFIDMSFGNNGEIIIMSKYYKFNVISMALLASLMIAFNLHMIPILGIEGAAFATLGAFSIYNIAKLIFIWIKLKILPFQKNTILVLAIATLTLVANMYSPRLSNPFLDIGFRSVATILSYFIMIYYSKASEEINAIIDNIIEKLFRAR